MQRKRKREDGARTVELAKLTAEFLYLAADLESLNPEAARILTRAALDLQRMAEAKTTWNHGPSMTAGYLGMRH